MVKIVDIGPDPKVVKKVTCGHCGAILEYVPRDVMSKNVSCMGDNDVAHYIICPNCNDELRVSTTSSVLTAMMNFE